MKKNFESVLLSILLGISILMGLSFWLNIKFGFNLFCAKHWDELSRLQATHTPVNPVFYVSVGLAIFIFIFGLYMIYKPKFKNIFKINIKTKQLPEQKNISVQQPESKNIKEPEQKIQEPQLNLSRPHRLNLPKNINEIAATKYSEITPKVNQEDTTKYNDTLAEIFKNNNYIVKKNPVISGFTPNLFAIGANEVLWIGGIDCDTDKIKNSITKLSNVFSDTLSDIQINIKAFLIDTMKHYNSDDQIQVFNTIDELKEFITNNPSREIADAEQEEFNAYSEYIDTIIQYIKNI